MRSIPERYLRAGAVLLGALVVAGIPAFVAVVVATMRLADLLGLPLLPGTAGGALLWLLAVGAALVLATEAAAVRLHGTRALWRGERRDRAVRYGTLAAVSLAALVAVGSFLAEAAGGRWRTGDPRTSSCSGLSDWPSRGWPSGRSGRSGRGGASESRDGVV